MEINKFIPLNVSSKFAICGLPIRVDTYKTCSFGCRYCFANYRKIMEFEKKLQIANLDWLERKLDLLDKREEFDLVAEVDGKAIALAELQRKKGYSSHVGGIAIGIHRQYRNIGIGTRLMKSLISQAKTMNLKILTLEVYSTNKRAIHVYEKLGFKETGRIPKGLFRNEKYIDQVIMVKELA